LQEKNGVTRKKSKKVFSAGVEARRAARNVAGSPPAGKIIADKRKKPLKHKKRILESELL
jgi:hypothetical protein